MARLPLFPLSVVLFPGASLPLHIFEPRYRRLLADVIEGDHRFVVLPPGPTAEAPAPGTVGTVAALRAVQPLEDGRSNIVVFGEGRVTLAAIEATETPYLVGSCEPFDDSFDTEGVAPADRARLEMLAHRLGAAMAVLGDNDHQPEFSDDPAVLTFQIAAIADWEFPAQHRFLSIRSATERATRLLATLPGLIARAEARAKVHQRAATNGTGKP
jgi:Lon protease-like protein